MSLKTLRPRHVTGLGPLALAAALTMVLPAMSSAQTLERIQTAGAINLGYETDGGPFSSGDGSAAPTGYAVRLCELVVDSVKEQLSLPDLTVNWLPIAAADRLTAVQSGQVDLMCSAVPETLANREDVSFSLPIFPTGVGALLHAGAPNALSAILMAQDVAERPIWRGAPARRFIDAKTFAVAQDSAAAAWLGERIQDFGLASTVTPVPTIADGVTQVTNGGADVLFGDIATLAAAAKASDGALVLLPRFFTHEPVALALARGDEDFRLAVDRGLSHVYRSDAFDAAFVEYFGEPAEVLQVFFDRTALPD